MTIPANPLQDELHRRAGIVCNCAHVAPTMPTCRSEHLPDCPIAASDAARRERERLAALPPDRLAHELAVESFVATHGQDALDQMRREFG